MLMIMLTMLTRTMLALTILTLTMLTLTTLTLTCPRQRPTHPYAHAGLVFRLHERLRRELPSGDQTVIGQPIILLIRTT